MARTDKSPAARQQSAMKELKTTDRGLLICALRFAINSTERADLLPYYRSLLRRIENGRKQFVIEANPQRKKKLPPPSRPAGSDWRKHDGK